MDVTRALPLTWVLLLGYLANGIARDHATTRIFPKGDNYTIHCNENFTLRCEGKNPVFWKLPNNTIDKEILKYSVITQNSSVTANYNYRSTLTIQNASYLDTGFYYCHEADADLNDTSRLSQIYLFVEDPMELSVLSETSTIISILQHSEVVLPCRPTSLNVEVVLIQMNGEELENVSYDPKTGFKLRINDSIDYLLYTCRFTYNSFDGETTSTDMDIVLSVTPINYLITKPEIIQLSNTHITAGEKLELECIVKIEGPFAMEWVTPDKNGVSNGRITISKPTKKSETLFSQNLVIEKTTQADQGEYVCIVRHQLNKINRTKTVRIYGQQEHFINLTEENNVYNMSAKAGDPDVQWVITVDAHPFPELKWYNNNNEQLHSGTSGSKNLKYEVNITSTTANLKIRDINIKDLGCYKLEAENKFENKTVSLCLDVIDKPAVEIGTDDFHMINEPSQVSCTAVANPPPSVFWYYKDCLNDSCDFRPMTPVQEVTDILLVKSYVNITASRSGYVKCEANNSEGMDFSVMGYFVTDVKNGFGIWGLDEDTKETENNTLIYPIVVNDNIELYCGASRYNYSNQLAWFKNDDQKNLENDDHYTIERTNTEFSNKILLHINNAQYDDSGYYTCKAEEKLAADVPVSLQDNIRIAVKDPKAPVIINTNMDKHISINFPDRLELRCYVKGLPKPKIMWYKNGKAIMESIQSPRVQIVDGNQKIIFNHTDVKDEGSYTCKAENNIGKIQKDVNLTFKNKAGPDYHYLIVIGILLFVFALMVLFLILRLRKERELRRELKRAGLANFENGAMECINPELGIDDQAELLPYDKKFEFPREKLKLGKQLGSGAFGVVMKAEAYGIVEGEQCTIVAVKMVKRNADYTYIRALASELKIMVHLGKHLNVVNLLGACTKNVAKRELLVLVEYCRFGNLHNYLLRHRDSFIDQIDPKTGKIDYTFGADIMERSFSVSSNKSKSPNVKYAALSFSYSDNNQVPNSMADYRGNFNYTGDTTCTDTTAVCMTPTGDGEDSPVASNNSVQPEWRSNYHGDYKGNVRPICTKDLITWAFQVARGMEYLASRKVLHGDLAARNILLADNNIVKICDFGLAKSMYKSDNYKKKGDGPLPVKWMAVESIRDRVFSIQSDVWSYGIVLWEFFSLARMPYPGMEANETFYKKLADGYRMESPQYATNEMYQIMCDCWHPRPLCRPSFTKLAEKIGVMLEECVRQHYVDLNDPYLVMNTQRLEEGHSDYLAMLSPPDFEHLSSPHEYVNDEIHVRASPNPMNTPGYMCMKSSHIFSPRLAEDPVFSFDVDSDRKHKNSNGEAASGTELLPMLCTRSESECETPNFTGSPSSYSNPTYHIPPSIKEKTSVDIVKSADNYINMPQSKSSVNNNVSPSTKSNNYVNSSSRDWERIKV